jgi:RNA polymerase sigma-70 factor (ECF subfamily)
LYYFTYAYLKSKEEAEGVVQEVFLRIWRNRKKLKPDLSFKAYLFKITYHCILEIFKQNGSRQLYLHSIANDAVHLTEEMNERLNYQMLLEKVDSLIAQLPPRQQEILIKRKKEDLPVKEIAHQLEISPKTVENHLTQALKKIRKGLGDNNIESMFL